MLPPPDGATARVVVVSRQGCHLCEQAEDLVRARCPDQWQRLDVDDDPALKTAYTDHVPVVWVDGKLLTYWTLAPEQLDNALAGGEWPPPPPL